MIALCMHWIPSCTPNTTGSLAQIDGRQTGWDFHVRFVQHGRQPQELPACGSGVGEQIRWLHFSIFVLWGFKDGKDWSPLQKNIVFPVLPVQLIESWLPLGTERELPPLRTPLAVSRAFFSHGSWQDRLHSASAILAAQTRVFSNLARSSMSIFHIRHSM